MAKLTFQNKKRSSSPQGIMKITIEHLENKAVVEDDSAHDICDAVELFEKALLKIGFQIERIDGGSFWKCREIEKKAREK